jgi:hypothetical protein
MYLGTAFMYRITGEKGEMEVDIYFGTDFQRGLCRHEGTAGTHISGF